MAREMINMTWSGNQLDGYQQMVIQQLAILFLQKFPEREWVDFTHEQVEGRLEKKSRGVFVTFAGTFFHADMGMVDGVRCTIDFLIPTGMERQPLQKYSAILREVTLSDGMVKQELLDPAKIVVSEVSLLA